jgi:RNA polymerase sigma-70 factor, ECF subfamily
VPEVETESQVQREQREGLQPGPQLAEEPRPELAQDLRQEQRQEQREDDIRLVAAAQRGERHAMDALLRKHYGYVAAITRRVTNNEADAADATQNALIAVAKGIHKFDGTSAFTTWLHRVATNAALDELRRRKRRPEPVSVGVETQDDDGAQGAQGAQERAVRNRLAALDINLDRIDDRTGIDGALAQIPFDFRAPVMLRDLCGLDYAEIAEVLGIPAGTVRSRIARGRAALAPLLRPMLDGSPPPTSSELAASPLAAATDSPPEAPGRDERHLAATELREPINPSPTSKATS